MAAGRSDGSPYNLQDLTSNDFTESSNAIAILSSEFTTKSGIRISVQRQDITTVYADCVVSAVDKHISLCGGVSLKLSKAAGKKVKKECADYIAQNVNLPVSEVFVSSGGDRWKNILHACGPRWEDYGDKAQCREKLTDTLFNCFIQASKLGHISIAVPAISSGSFRVPMDQSAKCYLSAITRFDQTGMANKLKNILFVDVKEDKVTAMQVRMHEGPGIKPAETLRLVLVGKTGVGKSHTGNTILSKNSFGVSDSMNSETAKSSLGSTVYSDHVIEVIDTPGLFDQADEEEDKGAHDDRIMKEILKSIIFSLPGPHVFCLFFRADDRYTKVEVEVYKQLEALFQVELKQFVMVVLTHSPQAGKHSLENILTKPPKCFDNLLNDVDRRIVGIDNNGPDAGQQVRALLEMALNVKNQNSATGTPFYTNSLVSRCLQLVQSDKFAKRSLGDIKQEVLQQSNSEVVIVVNKNVDKLTKAPDGCIIL